jgi:predicted TIM-barrel fold metal-dependent hydrolase
MNEREKPGGVKRKEQNMIIDAHAHVCPDKIAVASGKVFFERNKFAWLYDGTVGTFLGLMDQTGISKAFVVNVVLNPDFVSKANDFTASQISAYPERLVGLIYTHPDDRNGPGEIERCVKTLGFKAIKINGSLLRFFPEDERMQRVYEKAMDLGVPILAHCGPNVENFFKNPEEIRERQFAEPKSWVPVLKRFPRLRLILAHFAGSTHYYRDALEVLESFPHVLVDTSMVLNRLTSQEASSFIQTIGAERVLFGTDYPGHALAKEIEMVKSLSLTEDEKEKIFSKNAVGFFGLS